MGVPVDASFEVDAVPDAAGLAVGSARQPAQPRQPSACRSRGARAARRRRRVAHRGRRSGQQALDRGRRPATTTRARTRGIFPREDIWQDSWDVGVNVTFTLWNGGRTAAQVAEARHQADAARERLAEVDTQIALEVRQRQLDLGSARVTGGNRGGRRSQRHRGPSRRRRALRGRRRDEHGPARRPGRPVAGRARTHSRAGQREAGRGTAGTRARELRTPDSGRLLHDTRHFRQQALPPLRRLRRRRRCELRRAARRDLRVPRRQRRRQVDDHPHALRPAPTDERHGHGGRRRRRARSRGGEAAHRLHVAEVLALRGADRRPEHPLLRRRVRPRGRTLRAAPGLRARDGGPGRTREDADQGAGRRMAPAAGAGLRDPPRAADRVSRRADRRRRSGVAPSVLATDRPPVAAGHDGARHDALPRRSGALPSHRGDERRQARGAGHHARAQAGVRRPSHHGSAGAVGRGRDAGARSDAARSRRPACSARPSTRFCDRARPRRPAWSTGCARAGVAATSVVPVEPSLEDVFLDLVERTSA